MFFYFFYEESLLQERLCLSFLRELIEKIRRKCRIIFTETIHVKKNASFYVTKFLPILPFDVSLGKNYVKI